MKKKFTELEEYTGFRRLALKTELFHTDRFRERDSHYLNCVPFADLTQLQRTVPMVTQMALVKFCGSHNKKIINMRKEWL